MHGMTKILLMVIGTTSVALGIIGIVLPLLPTTPFLLLSAWCYARSSDRFYSWLINHPLLGMYIRNYLEKRGVPLRTKILALMLLWPSILISTFYIIELVFARILLLTIASCVTVHIVRLRTLPIEETVDDKVWSE